MAWSDLADLVNTTVRDTFGEAVTYTPAATGVPESIVCPFDAAAQVVEMQGDAQTIGFAPVIDVVLADLSVMPKGRTAGGTGDTCTVRGHSYAVVRVEPASHGTAKCILVRV